ncbi:hypothetical protein AB833_17090 [Chromatiales bacterium (ex Bugula neritina AB1)]|nr:hypothetical protein AB833_17090 [Chromatiales bacterium (ex Bugula neritina AB1)]
MDIVIVDDDAMVLALVKRVLRNSIYTYRCFSVPDEAIEFLSKNQTKIIVVDYRMPKTDGLSVIESIQSVINKREMPAIFLCSSIALPKSVQTIALSYGVIPLLKDRLMSKDCIEGLCIESR